MSDTATQTTGAQTTTGTETQTTTTADWTSALAEDQRGYVQAEGFKGVGELVSAYRGLKNLRGVPETRLVKLPEKSDDKDGWNDVYKKLGRPDKPEGYTFPKSDKPNVNNENFEKAARVWFHETGLTNLQGESIVKKLNTWVAEQVEANERAYQAKMEQEDAELKKEWGLEFDKNRQIGRQAAKRFGLTEDLIDRLEKNIGLSQTMKLFHNIGSKMGEADFVEGTSGKGFGSGSMTSEAAKSRIEALKQDKTFLKKLYTDRDADAKEEWTRLHKMAHPDAVAAN